MENRTDQPQLFTLAAALLSTFEDDDDVVLRQLNHGRVGFTRSEKLFCVLEGQTCKVKLSPTRVESLIRFGLGKRCRPSPDRSQWKWLALNDRAELWPGIVREAHAYVFSLEHRGVDKDPQPTQVPT